jgi:AraC family transcriptional regulator
MLLLELGTGRTRPMRPKAPLFSSGDRPGDGFLVEEHSPAEWESEHVSLLNSAVFLTLDEGATLQWRGGGAAVSKRIEPDRISILPANHPYSVRLRTSGRSLVVSLEQRIFSCAAAALGELGWVEPVWVHGLADPLLRELLLALREEMRAGEPAGARYAQSLVGTMAAHIVRRYSTNRLDISKPAGGLAAPALRRTVQHIQSSLDQNLNLPRLATVAGLSTCHFARMFKESTGLTPHHYVLNCRIVRAKQLLLNPMLELAEVALRSGFCDQAHMTRCFRQRVGTTPGAFARLMREQN